MPVVLLQGLRGHLLDPVAVLGDGERHRLLHYPPCQPSSETRCSTCTSTASPTAGAALPAMAIWWCSSPAACPVTTSAPGSRSSRRPTPRPASRRRWRPGRAAFRPAARTSAPAAAARGRTWTTPTQLQHKQAQVADALRRLGGFGDVELRDIEPAVEQYGYRNKLEFSWLQTPSGADLGFHVAGRWDQLMAVETCHIASAAQQRAAPGGRRLGAASRACRPTTSAPERGYLRHLVVREGRRTGDLLGGAGDRSRRRAGRRGAGPSGAGRARPACSTRSTTAWPR